MKQKIASLFKEALRRAKSKKIDHLFLSGIISSTRGVGVFEQSIDSVFISDEIKMGVWVGKNNQWACSSLEKADEKALDLAIDQAAQATQYSDSDSNYVLAEPQNVSLINYQPDSQLVSREMKDFEEAAMSIELNLKDYSNKITNIPFTECSRILTTSLVMNSNGVEVFEDNGMLSIASSAVAEGSDKKKVNYTVIEKYNSWANFNIEQLVKKIAVEAVGRIGPHEVETGKYPVLFDPHTSMNILSNLSQSLSGELVYRKLSRFTDKLDLSVASSIVTLTDSGKNGLSPHQFDAEGSLCQSKNLIEKGFLKSFLHNLYTAKKTGQKSTGNAAGGIGSAPGVQAGNLSWGGELTDKNEIIKSINKGILVTEMNGASASPISGDFSYGTLGYWIENGKIQHPIADFTIAGNFFDLLKNIKAIGNDLEWGCAHRHGSLGGRSILVSELSISGK